MSVESLASAFVSQVHTGWASAHRLPDAYTTLPLAERRAFLKVLRTAGLIQRSDKLWEAPPEVVDTAFDGARRHDCVLCGERVQPFHDTRLYQHTGDWVHSKCMEGDPDA